MIKGENLNIVEEVRNIVFKECKDKKWNWETHIKAVVKYSKLLAKKLNADEEICEISAWLHDIVKIRDSKQTDHQVKGADEAERILRRYGYSQDRINKVKHCIISHSSDKIYIPKTKEAEIVASADALALLDNFLELAHFVYGVKGYSVEEGRKELVKRYRSYLYKLDYVSEAKEIGKAKAQAVRLILGNMNF